nr:MAG TPA: hypothetical protein [Caudoviricetes sp.]
MTSSRLSVKSWICIGDKIRRGNERGRISKK